VTPPDPHLIAAAAGSSVITTRTVPGGDICQALRIDLLDTRSLFVKHRAGAPSGMFRSEARGLRWLAAADALRTPQVVAVGDDWLALEWVERGRPDARTDEALGRGLARLHRSGAGAFGAPWEGFIGTVAVPNDGRADWPAFLAECRLIPLAHAASLDAATWGLLDRVVARLPELVGPAEPPARLHGDLWAGNRMTDASGSPVLVDPAAFGGHREVDLAMMLLFGGFPERVFDAYHEEYPLEPGWRERVPLNQLIPLLVHAVMFGGGYAASVHRTLAALA
jgi:fructosamine-3-kinase